MEKGYYYSNAMENALDKCFNSFKSPGSWIKTYFILSKAPEKKYASLKLKIIIFNHSLSVNNFETQMYKKTY